MTRLCDSCGCVVEVELDRTVIDEDDDGNPIVFCGESCAMAFWDQVDFEHDRELREQRQRVRESIAEDWDPIAEDLDD